MEHLSDSRRALDAFDAAERVVATVIAQVLSCSEFRDSSPLAVGSSLSPAGAAIPVVHDVGKLGACSALTMAARLPERESYKKLAETANEHHGGRRSSALPSLRERPPLRNFVCRVVSSAFSKSPLMELWVG